MSACQYKLLVAWYGTTNDPYTVTGNALEDAVYSGVCRISRAAYNQLDRPRDRMDPATADELLEHRRDEHACSLTSLFAEAWACAG
jgi:hypothetical protein